MRNIHSALGHPPAGGLHRPRHAVVESRTIPIRRMWTPVERCPGLSTWPVVGTVCVASPEAAIDLKLGDYTLTMQFADGLHRFFGKKMAHTIRIKAVSAK